MSGNMMPPPKPCSTRKAMSEAALQLSAHRAELTVNSPSANSHSRLPPNRVWAQLTKGIATASASR